MRYNTGNPVGHDGSSDPRDLYDNAGVIDVWCTDRSRLDSPDRLGVPRKTMFGLEQQVVDFLISMAYESTYLVYGAGVVVERQTQLVQRNGELYRVMNAADVPLTLTGTWATDAPKLQAVGDAALRAALATSSGAEMVGYRDGTVADYLGETASVKARGAIGDGTYHPLSERFGTSLAAAQAEYPFVTSLTQSIDWAACQKALNAGGVVDFSGRQRNYVISDQLTVTLPGTTLKLEGCALTASTGFSGDMMLSLPVDYISLQGGATLDAANMPAITSDFSTSSFKGFAIGQKGASGAEIKGLNVSGGLILVRNSPAAAFGATYATDFHVGLVAGEFCDNSTAFVGPGVLYFNRCSRYSLGDMFAGNFKWKGLYNANGVDYSVDGAFCSDGVADQAAIFFVSSSGFRVSGLQARRAFGVKLDKCNDYEIQGMDINCGGVGQLGLMVQGCIGYTISGLFIRGFTVAGVEVSYHPGPPAANALVGVISNFLIRNGSAGHVAGVRMFGSTTETAGQLRISNGYVYACDRGVQVRNVLSGAVNRQMDVSNVTIDTFVVAGIEGVSREMSLSGLKFYNAGASAVACIDLWHTAGQTVDQLCINDCESGALPTGVNFIRAVTTSDRLLKIRSFSVKGCTAIAGARFLDLALTQASDYLRSLTLSGNTHDGSATATSVGLSNAGPALAPQVCITGNNLLTSVYAKANIAFAETAASSKWNGVVENNMAGVTNKPNNV